MAPTCAKFDVRQKSLALTKAVYGLTDAERFRRELSLTDQIRRASVSVLSNIAEGFERGSNAEFVQILYIAKGSAGDIRAQLYVARELGYIGAEVFQWPFNLCTGVFSQRRDGL